VSGSDAILVATDDVADAELVKRALGDEFGPVFVSAVAERAVQDFEQHRPRVLVLAFGSLEKCQSFCVSLYKNGTKVHEVPHRTVVLCTKGEVRRAYELCRKGDFDDYVLFWPLTHDAPRLPMAVHQELRQLTETSGPSPSEWAAQARRVGTLEAVLDRSIADGGERIADAIESVEQATAQIADYLKQAAGRLVADAAVDGAASGVAEVLDRLHEHEITPRLASVANAVERIQRWADTLKQELRPLVDSACALNTLAARVRPSVVAVEDDEFQRGLLRRILDEANVDVTFAASAAEALGALRKCRPDLVLMDMNLPDLDGVEVTRRLKSVAAFAGLPIVMVTGHSEKDKVVTSIKAGATDFIVKPFDKATLLAKVRKLLYDGAG
jgi:DNA-binding response OmpR family regulator